MDARGSDAPLSGVRMRRVAMVTAIVAIAPLTIVGVLLTATSWWDGVGIALAYLLSLGVLREWDLDGYPRRAILSLMVVGAAWALSALGSTSPIGFVPLALVGTLLLARTSLWRLWIPLFAVGVAAIGTLSFLSPSDLSASDTSIALVRYLILPFVGTIFVAAVILLSERAWLIVRRLERAKEAEAELAVAHERARFAGDLHDIQGQSLHVIKLKAALALRTLRSDPVAADSELREIRRLADETIAETRSLAYARRQLNLAAEIENARRLAEAAGIRVDARIDEGSADGAHPLLAQVLREATTNLLRHADPTTVTITARPGEVTVTNDGHIDPDAPLRGLARLRERVEAAGGVLRIERTPESFLVAVRLDPGPPPLSAGSIR